MNTGIHSMNEEIPTFKMLNFGWQGHRYNFLQQNKK